MSSEMKQAVVAAFLAAIRLANADAGDDVVLRLAIRDAVEDVAVLCHIAGLELADVEG